VSSTAQIFFGPRGALLIILLKVATSARGSDLFTATVAVLFIQDIRIWKSPVAIKLSRRGPLASLLSKGDLSTLQGICLIVSKPPSSSRFFSPALYYFIIYFLFDPHAWVASRQL
jgi:hypothetical protein